MALFLCAASRADGRHATLASVVDDVYRRYAWVAVFSPKPASQWKLLQDESLATLQEIFTSELADAIYQDGVCVERTQEIFSLDFNILFDSQDPQATDLVIEAEQSGQVKVCFRAQEYQLVCVSYIGETVKGKAKISDIFYSGGRSLRQLLEMK